MTKFEKKTIQGKLSSLLNPALNMLGLILMPYHKIDETQNILEHLANELACNKHEPEWDWGNINVRPNKSSAKGEVGE